MNEELSIGTDIAGNPDVALTVMTDTDGNVPVDIKHLSADPENVAQFREQLHSKSQSKETGSTLTAEGETKRDASESPVLKHPAPNERKFFRNGNKHTPPFVAGELPRPSQSQSTDGSGKDLHEKSMKFDISSQSSALKTAGGAATRTSGISVDTSILEFLPASKTVTQAPSLSTSSAETLHVPGNRTAPHSYDGNETVSANAFVTNKPTGTKQRNVPEISKPLSKTVETASTSELPSETQTRERLRSSETSSEPHGTAVWETIPFLRTSNETIAPAKEPTAAQTSKSHAILIAQRIRDHVVDRILVSSSSLNAERTVTVQLSPRLLQDTEVQLTQNGTSLDIRLVSQNKDSVQFLQQHQSDLQTYLQGELKTYRAISVRVPSSQASSELSQPHDGRSRNRFDYQTADEEEMT